MHPFVFPLTDLAVIVKDKIDFYTRNKTFTGPISMEGNFKLDDMTYDDTAQMMYVSNTAGISSIFGVNLMNGNVTSILTNRKYKACELAPLNY